jgi:hypothetical protein
MLNRILRKELMGMGISMLAVSITIETASAQVKPGDVISTEECRQGAIPGLAGVYYTVRHGMHMNIVVYGRDREVLR